MTLTKKNLIFLGAPGAGKSMLARRLPSILPDMTRQEALDKAQPGEPVCLLQDIVNETLYFTNSQNYVFSGRGTKGFRLTAPIKVSTVLNLKDGATIKLVDIFVDGGGDELTTLASLFSIGTNCVLTLGAGTTVRNVKTSATLPNMQYSSRPWY